MRSQTTAAAWLGGAALLGLLAPAATAQETAPPPGRPATLPPPATAEEVQETTPAPAATPAPAPEAAEEQEREDRALAETMRTPAATAPAGVTVAIPPGYVRIAIDLDNDGTFDAVETISADALRQARRLTDERQLGGLGAGGAGMPGAPAGMAPSPDFDEIRLSGTVQDVREFRLAGLPSPHRIARLETDQGVAKVDLGPAEALQAMGIEPGDEISVVGHRGMINDRPILMAREVAKGDQSTAIERPEDRRIKRVRGEILGLRSASFRTRDEEYLIAEVELRNGQQAEVILGPKAKVDELGLSEGDEVALLVRPARLNGRLAMAAEQVRAGDKAVAIAEPVEEPVQTEPGSEKAEPGPESQDDSDSKGQGESLVPRLDGSTGGATTPGTTTPTDTIP